MPTTSSHQKPMAPVCLILKARPLMWKRPKNRFEVSANSWKRSGDCAMIVSDVVCPFCGCLCDDLELEVEGDRVVRVQNGCSLAEATFIHDTRLPAPIRRTESGWENISY